MSDYLKIPSGREHLAIEVKKLIDDYLGRRVTLEDTLEQIAFWAYSSGEFMFDGDKWNPTFSLKLGKKRLAMLKKMLPPLQMRLRDPLTAYDDQGQLKLY